MRNRVALSALLLAFAASAWPQAAPDPAKCFKKQPDLDQVVQYCTAVINSDELSYGDHVQAYYKRGDAYFLKSDFDRVIQNYTDLMALNENPQDARAFNARGLAYILKGDYDLAVQDFDKALSLLPTSAALWAVVGSRPNMVLLAEAVQAFYYRGDAYFLKGDDARAIQDYKDAVRASPRVAAALAHPLDAFWIIRDYDHDLRDKAFLWLYLAQSRGGLDAAADLKKNAAHLDLVKWPGPILRLYLGDLQPQDLLQSAQDPDPQKTAEHVCEANFYMGENSTVQGKRAEATAQLHKALDTCPRNFIEHSAAQSELARLEKLP